MQSQKKLAGLIGYGIQGSSSPQIQEAEAASLGSIMCAGSSIWNNRGGSLHFLLNFSKQQNRQDSQALVMAGPLPTSCCSLSFPALFCAVGILYAAPLAVGNKTTNLQPAVKTATGE